MEIGKTVYGKINRQAWYLLYDEQWETLYSRINTTTWVLVHDMTWLPVDKSRLNLNYENR